MKKRLPVLLLLLSCLASHADTAARPNIVLVMADDQGWGDMAYNGHPFLKTPVFDEMARTALRFDRFYAAAPVCSPTRGSVLTGRHPVRFGCFAWGRTLRPQEITVAEALRDEPLLISQLVRSTQFSEAVEAIQGLTKNSLPTKPQFEHLDRPGTDSPSFALLRSRRARECLFLGRATVLSFCSS